MKIPLIAIVLLLTSSLVKADYQFNNLNFSLSSIKDTSLPEDLEGQQLSSGLSGEIADDLILSGAITLTAYDDTTINGVYVDYAAHGFTINMAKYREFKNENKLFAYIGLTMLNTEIAIDIIEQVDSDIGLSYGAGLIAAINPQMDFIAQVDINTLFNDTNQAISLGLSFDLDSIAAIETLFTHQDTLDAISLGIRFNYE